jgi:hypothetical protein
MGSATALTILLARMDSEASDYAETAGRRRLLLSQALVQAMAIVLGTDCAMQRRLRARAPR